MVCMSAEYNYQKGKVSIDNFMLCANFKYNRHFEPTIEPNFECNSLVDFLYKNHMIFL